MAEPLLKLFLLVTTPSSAFGTFSPKAREKGPVFESAVEMDRLPRIEGRADRAFWFCGQRFMRTTPLPEML